MNSEEFDYGYQEGIREAEKHMVNPDTVNSIHDGLIDEITGLQTRLQAKEQECEGLKKLLLDIKKDLTLSYGSQNSRLTVLIDSLLTPPQTPATYEVE